MNRYLVLVFLLTFARGGYGQTLAYVHYDSILMSYPGYMASVHYADSVQKSLTRDLKERQNNLQDQLNHLLGPYNPQEGEDFTQIKMRMNPMDTARLNLLLIDDQMQQNRARSYDNMINFIFERDIKPVIINADAVLAEYARKNKIDAIYKLDQIGPFLAYLNQEMIITQQIIAIITNNQKKKESTR